MRRVLGTDLHIAARYLLRYDKTVRSQKARALLRKADRADAYRRQHRLVHPEYGNGTLTGAVGLVPLPPERHVDDPDYGHCLLTVLQALLHQHAGQDAQPIHTRTVGSSSKRRSAMSSPQVSQ